MSISRQNLSIIIVSFNSNHVIHQCIESIDKQIEIIVIDNSNNKDFKKDIENQYQNVKCILSLQNNGMGAGNNLGIKNTTKDFALILNPDIILEQNMINEIIEASSSLIDFSVIAPISNNLKFPNYKFKKENNNKLDIINPFKVKSVDGYAMLLNLKKIKKFKDFYFFDENFFLYLENDDLCKRMKQIDDNIYVVPKAKINHLGGQAVEPKYKDEVEYTRNWHWMWSKFYYNKKHYGYFNAVYKTLSNLISAIFKIIYYLVTGNKHKKKIYEMRFFGLLNSMLGNKSFYRPNLKN